MGTKEFRLAASELKTVEVLCVKCGAGVVFNAALDTVVPPRCCPSCGESYEGSVFVWLTGYRKWYQAVSSNQQASVYFRVAAEEQ